MQPVQSTAHILACKILNRVTEKVWVDWAYEMLTAGFDTEHLLILAGMEYPLEYFEMRKLTDRVLTELNLDYSDTDNVIAHYASYLSRKGLNGEMQPFAILGLLKDIYIELDYHQPLQHFYWLYYAKEDLLTYEDQWYVNGVDRSNIDQTIIDYFKQRSVV